MELIRALERGDWRTARRALNAPTPVQDGLDPLLGVTLKDLGHGMGRRATGDLRQAWTLFAAAADRLGSRRGVPVHRANGGVVVVLPDPPPDAASGRLVWEVARVLWREQCELLWLRDEARRVLVADTDRDDAQRAGRGAREIAVLAYVEYLCRIEFDPWTWRSRQHRDALDDLVDRFVKEIRSATLVSATRLRQVSRPDAGDVSKSVWQKAGELRGIRERALEVLAGRPRPPWFSRDQTSDGVPAWAGSVLAWEYARQWAEMTDSGPPRH